MFIKGLVSKVELTEIRSSRGRGEVRLAHPAISNLEICLDILTLQSDFSTNQHPKNSL